jgi:hypothetical protein
MAAQFEQGLGSANLSLAHYLGKSVFVRYTYFISSPSIQLRFSVVPLLPKRLLRNQDDVHKIKLKGDTVAVTVRKSSRGCLKVSAQHHGPYKLLMTAEKNTLNIWLCLRHSPIVFCQQASSMSEND